MSKPEFQLSENRHDVYNRLGSAIKPIRYFGEGDEESDEEGGEGRAGEQDDEPIELDDDDNAGIEAQLKELGEGLVGDELAAKKTELEDARKEALKVEIAADTKRYKELKADEANKDKTEDQLIEMIETEKTDAAFQNNYLDTSDPLNVKPVGSENEGAEAKAAAEAAKELNTQERQTLSVFADLFDKDPLFKRYMDAVVAGEQATFLNVVTENYVNYDAPGAHEKIMSSYYNLLKSEGVLQGDEAVARAMEKFNLIDDDVERAEIMLRAKTALKGSKQDLQSLYKGKANAFDDYVGKLPKNEEVANSVQEVAKGLIGKNYLGRQFTKEDAAAADRTLRTNSFRFINADGSVNAALVLRSLWLNDNYDAMVKQAGDQMAVQIKGQAKKVKARVRLGGGSSRGTDNRSAAQKRKARTSGEGKKKSVSLGPQG